MCSAALSTDVLSAWAVTNPAMAQLLWVIVLVLATLLLWLFFSCYSWKRSASPSLERYLAGRWALNPLFCGCVEACDRLTVTFFELQVRICFTSRDVL